MLEAQLLLTTAALIALLHTVLGPDHYLPFVALGKARKWSRAKTLRVTFYCGLGHVMSSVLIGGIGIFMGTKLTSLVAIEGMRGSMAGWVLLMFGCIYFIWGLRKAGKAHSHSHIHAHGELVHRHHHNHAAEHAHVHVKSARSPVTPLALFIIFILGPCEALIPLFMYPAAVQSSGLVVLVALVFGSVTLVTMLLVVATILHGTERLSLPSFGRFSHAAAGASIAACGAAISFIGL